MSDHEATAIRRQLREPRIKSIIKETKVVSEAINQIVRESQLNTPLVASTVIAQARASLKNPTRPFTPAPANRSTSRDGELPAIDGLRVSAAPHHRHRIILPARALHPRRLDPLQHPQLHQASSKHHDHNPNLAPIPPPQKPNQPYTSPTRKIPATKTTNFIFPEGDIVSPDSKTTAPTFPTTLQSLLHLLTSFPETFKHVNTSSTLPHTLSHLNETLINVHTQLTSIQYLRDPSTEIPKPVLKQHRDKVVESLMNWMQVPESCGMDVTVEVEMAVGVCGLVIRLTRDDRVLGNAFKLLFKLSKSGANDGAFGRYNIPDGISLYLNHLTTDKRLLIAHKCDMAIYAVATLKNLTTGGELSFESEKDTEPLISIMSRMMWFLIKNDAITSKTSQQRVSQTIQLFIQITLTFRNLLTLHQSQTQTQLLTPIPCDTMSASTKPLEVLITILSTPGLLESQELLLTVSRILSKISLDETCLSAMSSLKTWNKLVDLVIQFQNKKIDPQPLLVRLLFVLGNLSTPNDADPVQQDYTEYCDDFVALFWKYGKRVARDLRKEIGYACSMNGDGGLEEEDGFESSESVDEESSVLDGGKKGKHGKRKVSDFVVECEDVLIKITRLISNMSIHPPSGEQMSQMIELELMLQLLELACASESSLVRHEELVLNLAGALANFTFYQNEQNCLFQQSIQVLELMLPLLLHENNELVDQATRVYSNLSRPSNSIDSSDNSIYNWMAQHRGGIELLTILLEHPSRSILINVCGTLLNLFCPSTVSRKGPFQCAMTLVKCGGIHKLLDLVQQALSDGDLVCTSVACKSLVCLIELQEASGEEWLTDEEEERLGMLMIGYLDIVDPPLMDPPPLLRMQSQQDLFKGVEGEEASHLHNVRERNEDKISGEEKELIAVAKRVLHVLGCNGDINDALLDEGPEIDPRISIRKEVGI